jgi:hypothetical protein
MRQAISTKYLGPTDYRGGRIKATADAGSVTLGWDHALSSLQNHAEAARALALKLGWTGKYYMGGTGNGYHFVYADTESFGFETSDANGEGLTFAEWLAAAGVSDTGTSQYDLRAAWRAGEDPTEYRSK